MSENNNPDQNQKKDIKHNTESEIATNTVILSMKEWLAVGISFIALIFFLIPFVWSIAEKISIDDNFRINQDYNEDYWLYKACAEKASRRFPVLFLGDSVIWGRFVQNEETIPAYLNTELCTNLFGNIAMNGLHPAAMYGLIRHFGNKVMGSKVIIHLNPIWMNSIEEDLRGTEEKRINQPRLLPQFTERIPSYQEKIPVKSGIVMERMIPGLLLANHLRLYYFDGKNFSDWVIDNPEKNPLSCFNFSINPLQKTNNVRTMRIFTQDWEWIALGDSLQWSYFQKTISTLKKNENYIFIYVGSINPYIMTPESLKKYRKLQEEIKTALAKNGIPFYFCPDLPDVMYADASHQVKEGYAYVAKLLAGDSAFRQWIK